MAKKKKKHLLAGCKCSAMMRGENGELIPWYTVTFGDDGEKTVVWHTDEQQTEQWVGKMLDNASKTLNNIVNREPENHIRKTMEQQGITECEICLMDALKN